MNDRSAITDRATHRRTPTSARGEPMIWLTGAALVVCLVMIAGLVGMILVNGLTTYWPRPIERVALADGSVFLGIPTDTDDNPDRVLYRTGNRDIGREPFRWVERSQIVSATRDPDAVLLERESWGIWLGVPERAIERDADGRETVVAEGAGATRLYLEGRLGAAHERKRQIETLKRDGLGRLNKEIDKQRLRVRRAELDAEGFGADRSRIGWVPTAALGVVCVVAAWGANRLRSAGGRTRRIVRFGAIGVSCLAAIAVVLHGPWRAGAMSSERLGTLRESTRACELALQGEYDRVLARVRELEAEDGRYRVYVVEPTEGRFAPVRQIEPESPLQVSQIVRAVDANRLGLAGKFGVYLSRWREFLTTQPRSANTEGGVFPVILGTVMLTLLLTVTVTPLGVIAALYLREYTRQGLLTSIIRIAVNNLAGVPSIVYGVFGLGFFCYTVGRYVDSGPDPSSRMAPGWWWLGMCVGLVMAVGAYGLGVFARPRPGEVMAGLQPMMRRAGWLLWAVAFGIAIVLVARTPFFGGFFAAKAADGSPTFGGRGMLWAALTLALLTLPVVIVSTEEAIAAVPNSMREGSYGCGASKWQTLRRIVLPGALPGILTGAILAMARGAGEVAPLMLVGAVKLSEKPPVSGEPPFLHLDRSFMHLGFHIYDLGFQSPDSQAARPLVWTTTLLLLTIVLTLNLFAILIRARLRARLVGSAV